MGLNSGWMAAPHFNELFSIWSVVDSKVMCLFSANSSDSFMVFTLFLLMRSNLDSSCRCFSCF